MKTFSTALLILSLSLSSFAGKENVIPNHQTWNRLLNKYVSEKGLVNYKGFISEIDSLNFYLETLSNNPPDTSNWTINEQKAYWINAYNAFTVKLICDYYPVKSIKDIGAKMQVPFVNTPWDIKFIRIGQDSVDLNYLEHGQLRKNFEDPLVHFSLVCASESCPILLNKAYFATSIESQLILQAKVFIHDESRNKLSESAPQLSKIFDWYGMDFKTKKMSVIDFINKYSTHKIHKKAKVSYLEYSWNLNEQK